MPAFMNVSQRKEYRIRTHSHPADYFNLYRFRQESVKWLAEHFLEETDENRGASLSQIKRMEIFLRFLSDPGFQMRVGKEEGIHRTAVCKRVKHVFKMIMNKAHLWIKFPANTEQIKLAQEQWILRYDFPCAIGAIDCMHVAILKPPNHGDEYINRKGFCSINVQATCNAKEEFMSIDCSWPGSVHDSRILKRSHIFNFMNNQRSDAIILGDIGYGIRPWLLTPYKTPRTREEICYNKHHTKSRVVIERCFGQLKRRFPILQYRVRVSLNKVASVIVSCVVLHNIAIFLKDDFEILPETIELFEDVEEDEHADSTNNLKEIGQRRRQEIANVLNSLSIE